MLAARQPVCLPVGLRRGTREPAEQRRAASFRGDWGGKGTDRGEHHSIPHAPGAERETHVPVIAWCAARSSPPFIFGKSHMPKRPCTDLRGGRSAMVVPTATVIVGMQTLPLGQRTCVRVVVKLASESK